MDHYTHLSSKFESPLLNAFGQMLINDRVGDFPIESKLHKDFLPAI